MRPDGSQKLFIARAINEHHIAETRDDGGGRPWQVGPHVTVLLPPLDVREGYGRGVGGGGWPGSGVVGGWSGGGLEI